jgi:PAS domain S-box-containing protein
LGRTVVKDDETRGGTVGRTGPLPANRDDLATQELLAEIKSLAAQNRELWEARDLLEESRDRYADLYDFAPLGYVTFDGAGVIVEVNLAGAILLNQEREHLVGTHFAIHLAGDDRARFRDYLRQCREGRAFSIELRLRGRGGEEIDARLTTIPVADFRERRTLYRAAVADISEWKRLEREIVALNGELAARAEALEKANRELESFGYTLAHDLRGILTNISCYNQALQEIYGRCLDEQGQEFLREINRQTRKMDHLIGAMFDFSRVTAAELRREEVDLSAMAQLIAADLRLKQPKRRVTFEIAAGATAVGDTRLLRVVLANLLENAWKYTGRKKVGVIAFGMTGSGPERAYCVRDNGVGFDMGEAAKIFEPFQRLHDQKEYKGHGVGLATVQRIVLRHGGRVWAEGEPGKGATFCFTLPSPAGEAG